MKTGQIFSIPSNRVGRIGCRSILLVFLVSAMLVAGCARPPTISPEAATLYQSVTPPNVQSVHTPVFLISQSSRPFNRIGTPSAREIPGESPEIHVDPARATIYYESQEFNTERGHYTNLIYRVHFPEVPLDWDTINLTAGRNPGLLIIYTLNDRDELVLVTTVHTCGCYLAFLPTGAMPAEAYPADWPAGSQEIYGYTLPSRINVPQQDSDERIMFTLAGETHRIRGVDIEDRAFLAPLPRREMAVLSMDTLYALPYKDGTTSFFETEGTRAGYVKGSSKILERLLISWWALDCRVGEDKAYGNSDHSDAVFYTSLKFWDRRASDLKDFAGFLSYWGWGL